MTETDILAQRYDKSPDLVYRKIAEEYVLVPIRHDAADMEAVYTLEGIGARIWELIDGERTGYEILAQILEEYEVTRDVAEADLREFLGQLGAVEGLAPDGTHDDAG